MTSCLGLDPETLLVATKGYVFAYLLNSKVFAHDLFENAFFKDNSIGLISDIKLLNAKDLKSRYPVFAIIGQKSMVLCSLVIVRSSEIKSIEFRVINRL